MAEYYSLIARAVASLRAGAPEARQAIYGRAKQALVGQLRGMQPPVPEEAINKEIAALDEAIARIEAEIGAPDATPPPPGPRSAGVQPTPTPDPVVVSEPRPPVEPAAPGIEAAPSLAVPRPAGTRPPAPAVPNTVPASARSERVVFERRPSLPAARPPPPRASRPTAPGRIPAAMALAGEKPLPGEAARAETATPEARQTPASTAEPGEADVPADATMLGDDLPAAPPSVSLPTAPTLETPDFVRSLDSAVGIAPVIRARTDDGADDAQAPPVPDILAGETRGRDEALRPAIPRRVETAPRDLRVWIVAVAALAVLAAIALMAWKLRDDPEQLARVPAPVRTEPAAGKIVERADSPAEETDADGVAAASTSSAASPVPAAGAAPGAATQPASGPAIAVAYKAAVLVAAPDTPEKVRTYVGTVVWRTESVAEGQGQPLGIAVRADIDVPDAKFQAVMELRKNTEAQFPASHTMDLKFTVGTDSPIGSVKLIDVPRMRGEDAAAGDPLVGVPVTITPNYFLVGLTRGGAEQRNMEALRARGWIDIPMVLDNSTPAKITFEKGALGQQILDDALQAWNRS